VAHNRDMGNSQYNYSRSIEDDVESDSNYYCRYIIRALDPSSLKVVYDTTIFIQGTARHDFSTTIDLPEVTDRCQLYTWSDYVTTAQRDSDLFYNTADFAAITHRRDHYQANTDLRDCFSGSQPIDLTQSEQTIDASVTLSRPVGRFTIISTDVDKFKSLYCTGSTRLTDYKVRCVYPSYTPNNMSIIKNQINDVTTGTYFDSPIIVDSSDPTKATIGFDYVMLSDSEAAGIGVAIALFLIDPKGTLTAISSNINVPMKRNNNTLVMGDFLTTQTSNRQGGIGIDFSFAGEYLIFL
jgi:hypothetical protein